MPIIIDYIINSMPHPQKPINIVSNEEVSGGLVGNEENLSNLQEGVPSGRELSHVFCENQKANLRKDFPAPATTPSQSKPESTQPIVPISISDNASDHSNIKEGMAKDLGAVASINAQGSKTRKKKLRKVRRDTIKKKKKKEDLINQEQVNSDKRCMLEDEPSDWLKTSTNPADSQSEKFLDNVQSPCTLNNNSLRPPEDDKYIVIQFEDEVDLDN